MEPGDVVDGVASSTETYSVPAFSIRHANLTTRSPNTTYTIQNELNNMPSSEYISRPRRNQEHRRYSTLDQPLNQPLNRSLPDLRDFYETHPL